MEAEAENETSPCIPLLSSVYFCLEWGVDMQPGRKVEHVMKWHKNWLPPNIIYILTLTKTSFDSLILFEANYILNYLIESSINNIMPPPPFPSTKPNFSLKPLGILSKIERLWVRYLLYSQSDIDTLFGAGYWSLDQFDWTDFTP